MSPAQRRIHWRFDRIRRHLKQSVCRRLYRDPGEGPGRSVMISGTARSGTTWLAELIDAQLPSRLMFEPFQPELVEEFRGYEYFQYMRPGEDDPGLLAYCRKVFSGQIRHPWIDRRVEHLFPKLRVIKDIRTPLFLRWIRRHFPQMPIVFVIRHPCAVAASRLHLGWDTDKDIGRFLGQGKLWDDYLKDKAMVIDRATTAEEKHAIIWCVSHLVPLSQFARGELDVLFYENLCSHPEVEIPRLFELLGRPSGEPAIASADRPSTTTRPDSAVVTGDDRVAGWQHKLTPAQIDRVLGIVEQFGLGRIYGDSIMPALTDPCLTASDA